MHCLEYLMDGHEINNFAVAPEVFPTWGVGRSAHEVFLRILEYFPRELSFAADNLKAIEGILEAFGGAQMENSWRARHLYGATVLYNIRDEDGEKFDGVQGLAWWIIYKSSGAGRKKNVDSFDSGLPSWTWASWKSARLSSERSLHFGYMDPQLDIARSVKCHITDRDGGRVDLFHYAVTGSKRYSDYHP